jgi:hypothetical protein
VLLTQSEYGVQYYNVTKRTLHQWEIGKQTQIIPMLFVTVVLIGQKQNLESLHINKSLNIHTHLKSVTRLNHYPQYVMAIGPNDFQ